MVRGFNTFLRESEYIMNVRRMSLKEAIRYAQSALNERGRLLRKELPYFNENFLDLKRKLKHSTNIPRDQMPVIEPEDADKFEDDLKSGRVDIFKPYSDMLHFDVDYPKDVLANNDEQIEWTHLGLGEIGPDSTSIAAPITFEKAIRLTPTQNEIWFEKLVDKLVEDGPAEHNGDITHKTLIISKNGYILDGHHRYGQIYLSDPHMTVRCLHVPLTIEALVKVGKGFEQR